MPTQTIKGKVAAILNSRELVINKGESAGIEKGMIFQIYGQRDIKDPDSDAALGSIEYEKGRVKIVDVQEKLSIARTFKTYRENIGGIGSLLTEPSRMFEPFLEPPNWVTHVQTLEFDAETSGIPIASTERTIHVSKGDIVKLAPPEEDKWTFTVENNQSTKQG